MRTPRRLILWAAALLACCLLCPAPALARQDRAGSPVQFSISTNRTYVGQAVTLEVEISSDGDVDGPEAPAVDGAEVDALMPSRFESTSIVNGRVSRRLSVTHRFQIRPTVQGVMTIPPVTVTVDGRRYSSDTYRVNVMPLASDDRFLADIVAEPAEAWVGQGVDLTLRIWVRRFTDSRFNVTVPAENMWGMMDDGSVWGTFESKVRSLAQSRSRPPDKVMRRPAAPGGTEEGDATYDVFEITRRVYPGRPGPLDVGQIVLRILYPTRLDRGTDIFDRGRLRVVQSVPLVAVPPPPDLIVKALPEDGRPANFVGAVGRFEIESSAKPLDVAVGDPIDLSIVIKDRTIGGADLASVSAPPIAAQPDIAADFRVGSDPLAGDVQGWLKTFTQVIRPLREGVTAIPPIVLAYFDPTDGRYHEVSSQAIPIKVRRGVALDPSRIVDARGDVGPATTTPVSESGGGILANETRLPQLLRRQSLGLTPLATAAAVAPPLAFATLAAVLLVRRRADADQAGRRRRGAGRRAEQALARASDPGAVRAALIEYVGDLSGRPPGTMTADEAVAEVRSRGAAAQQVEALRRVLATCEQQAYAPTGRGADIDALRAQAAEALGDLRKCEVTP